MIAWLFGPLLDRLEVRGRQRRILRLESEARARPHDERVLLNLADQHRAAGHLEAAIQRYWQAAQLHVTSCHYAKALAVIQNALELQPEALFLRRGAAQTLERLGRNHDAAQAYRQAADIAERRGRTPDAEHLRGRADMLAPVKRRRMPTIVRDLVPEDSPAPTPPPPPDALPLSPLGEALSAPAGGPRSSGEPAAAAARATPPPVPSAPATPAPEPQTAMPSVQVAFEDPVFVDDAPPMAADEPPTTETPVFIPRAGPAHESGPEVPILKVAEAMEVDAVVAQEMARAFGEEVLDGRRPSAARLDPAVEEMAREAARNAPSTQLALDAEVFLLAHDPAEAATAQCSPVEIQEIRTRTLLSQAERELQSCLTIEDSGGDVHTDRDPTFA